MIKHPFLLAVLAIMALGIWSLFPLSSTATRPSHREDAASSTSPDAGTPPVPQRNWVESEPSHTAEPAGNVPRTVLSLAGPVAGQPLDTTAPVVRSSPEKSVGRIAPVDAETLARLDELVAGSVVTIPLPDGSQRAGAVNLARRDSDGWMRVGGSLDGGGSFALSHRNGESAGLIQLPAERRAWQLRRALGGELSLIERRLDEVVCLPLPRPDPGYLEAIDDEPLELVPPLLSSRPNANHVLYLDFDGESVNDINWNEGRTINARKARLGKRAIRKVWDRVAGDYIAFDIDVTTNVARYAAATVGKRMRCIITRDDDAAPGAGGVAYLDSFAQAGSNGFTADTPCWVFIDFLADACAEAISHELGHTFGLNHDGRDFANGGHQEYYAGQGSGTTGWAPIMGVAYYRRLSQWSKGEYANPSNTEDDLAIITNQVNGFGYAPDDAGDTRADPADLAANGNHIEQSGIISNQNDLDFFQFTTNGGTLAIRVKNEGVEGNVDLLLQLQRPNGELVDLKNPGRSLSAELKAKLPSGTYFLRVSGTAKGNPDRTGYSAYGCIGSYRLVGKIDGLQTAPTVAR